MVMVPAPCCVPEETLASAARSDAQIVYTAMLVETLVFCGQNGLFHDIRDRFYRYDRSPFLAEFAQKVAFGRNDAQRDFGLVVGQGLERGQRRPQQGKDERPQQGADHAEAQDDRAQIEQPAL